MALAENSGLQPIETLSAVKSQQIKVNGTINKYICGMMTLISSLSLSLFLAPVSLILPVHNLNDVLMVIILD